MCVIIIDVKGKELDFAILNQAIERNGDGWGLTYAKEGKLVTAKGFGFKHAKREWVKATGHGRVFHARVGTSGTKNEANCHPFDATHADGPERVFFHNGVISSIPRFNESMCDSWHVARYLSLFKENEKLGEVLQSYAGRESSRFVVFQGGEKPMIHWYGRGWLQRDGVFYSNGSALGSQKVFNGSHGHGSRVHWEGAMLKPSDEEPEITSPEQFSGAGFDPERKLWSTAVKSLAVTHNYGAGNYGCNNGVMPHETYKWKRDGDVWDSKIGWHDPVTKKPRGPQDALPFGQDLRNTGASTGSIKSLQGTHPTAYYTLAAAVLQGKEAEAKAVMDKLEAWQRTALEGLLLSPWYNGTRGRAKLQLSYPADSDFLMANSKNANGYHVTYRTRSEKTEKWREIRYSETGEFAGLSVVDAPYEGGVCFLDKEIDSYNGVKAGAVLMSLKDWRRRLLYDMFKLFESEDDEVKESLLAAMDGKLIEPEDIAELTDAEVIEELDDEVKSRLVDFARSTGTDGAAGAIGAATALDENYTMVLSTDQSGKRTVQIRDNRTGKVTEVAALPDKEDNGFVDHHC